MRDDRQLNELRRFIRAVLGEALLQDPRHDFKPESFRENPFVELDKFLKGMNAEYADLEKSLEGFPRRQKELLGNIFTMISDTQDAGVKRITLLGDSSADEKLKDLDGFKSWATYDNLTAAKERVSDKIKKLEASLTAVQPDQPRRGTNPELVKLSGEIANYDDIFKNIEGLLYVMKPRGYSFESNIRRKVLEELKKINVKFSEIRKKLTIPAAEKVKLSLRFNELLKKVKDSAKKYGDVDDAEEIKKEIEDINGEITRLNTKLTNLATQRSN